MRNTVSLRENRNFKRMYARAANAHGAYVVMFIKRNKLSLNRLGLTVGTKLGGAVKRNRIRRRVKEAYRLIEDRLPHGYDVVLVARQKAETAPIEKIEVEISRLFLKLTNSLKGPIKGRQEP